MAYSSPTGDFVTSTLSGAIVGSATTATIGTGLNIPATNGVLQLDYDSSTAIGSDNGPETISYATYNNATGALTGLTRGLANTTNGTPGVGVAHQNGAHVSCGPSSVYFQQSPLYDTWNAAGTLTYASADSPTFTATITGDSTASIYPGVRLKAEQTQALSHYWTFNTNSAADKGSATMADIGTPTYTAGKFGNALTLNGSNQALRITDAAAFHLGASGAEFTVGAWNKIADATNQNTIYASWAKPGSNYNGIIISTVATTGQLKVVIGVGTTAVSTLSGITNICDNAYHYIEVTFRNNFMQLFIDGKLDASGYMPTPIYAATTYTNIGAYCETSTTPVATTWFKGQIDDLFLINGYALDEQTIAAKYAAATAQGTADLTLTKYFLCTASSYSAPNTTITLYGGTDHSLANATISNAYYSTQKAPYGFPLSADKWTQSFASYVNADQATPADQWYNLGSTQLSVPIGSWNLYAKAYGVSNATSYAGLYMTLSTSASVETYPETTTAHTINGTETGGTLTANKGVKYVAKTTVYLLAKRITSASTLIRFSGAGGATVIKATSTLL